MRDNDEIGFYLSLIKKKMDKHMNEGLKKYDLTKTQRDILGYLHQIREGENENGSKRAGC